MKKQKYLNHNHNNERAIGIEPPNFYGKNGAECGEQKKKRREKERESGKPQSYSPTNEFEM